MVANPPPRTWTKAGTSDMPKYRLKSRGVREQHFTCVKCGHVRPQLGARVVLVALAQGKERRRVCGDCAREDSNMVFRGTVIGQAARKYPGFTYRKPVPAKIDIWQLDPERAHPAHEFPRSVNPPSQPNTQASDLADYTVSIGAAGADGLSPVRVSMRPNQYTGATKPLTVLEFHVANAFELRREYVEEAERRAFG